MNEQIIISLTSWKPRLGNLPIVLDTIFGQTVKPDKVVLNLAYNEILPENILSYLKTNSVEVNYVEDSKVYKKLIPTLKRYPKACVINIDDDCIYPSTMIADFVEIHKKYPDHPISGNRVVLHNMQCHCGCASLTKWEYFGEWLNKIDKEVMDNCKSSDIVITYLANKNGYPYIRTKGLYFTNITKEQLSTEPYSTTSNYIDTSMDYLNNRFGEIDLNISSYINDTFIATIMRDVFDSKIKQMQNKHRNELIKVYNNFSFKLGKLLTAPFRWIKKSIN